MIYSLQKHTIEGRRNNTTIYAINITNKCNAVIASLFAEIKKLNQNKEEQEQFTPDIINANTNQTGPRSYEIEQYIAAMDNLTEYRGLGEEKKIK